MALLLAGYALEEQSERKQIRAQVYRIGADHSPPYYFLKPDGKVEGLAVDVLSEAARRSGIRLVWVQWHGYPDDALRGGAVDLWPALSSSPTRVKSLHATRPWLNNNFCTISLKSRPVPGSSELPYPKVAHRAGPFVPEVVNSVLPGYQPVTMLRREEMLSSVCRGDTDAAVVEVRFLDTALLNRPPGCEGANLRVDVIRQRKVDLSIFSTKEKARVAEMLRDEVSGIALDGTLSTILEEWAAFSSIDARSVYALRASEKRNGELGYGLAGLIVLVSLLWWQTRRAQSAQRRALEEQGRAESAARVKSEFLATMSHEIRTPLNGILGMTGVVLEGPITEEKRSDLEIVQYSAESLLRIVNDVLDISKLEAGRLRIETHCFDLKEELRAVVRFRMRAAAAKGIRLCLQYGEELPTQVLGDSCRLRQVVMNMLENAIKFTARGEVTVIAERVDSGEQEFRLRISVKDTGIGISEEKQKILFQKFTQADSSTTRRFGGTGLGLAICKQLAELMNGSVGVSSMAGEGSTFWIELMLRLPEQRPCGDAVGAPESEQETASNAPIHVLVVEDNHINQQIMLKSLVKLGYHVEIAGDGMEAVALYKEKSYSLILMDCQMPQMDGFEATGAIRKLENGRHTPIVAITASALDGDRERCFSAGMDDYITKPVRFEQLRTVVARHAGLSTAVQKPVFP